MLEEWGVTHLFVGTLLGVWMSRLTLLFAPLLAIGCSEVGLRNDLRGVTGPEPDIEVDPPTLEYSVLTSGQEEAQTFVIRNLGENPLQVSEVVVGAGFAFTVDGRHRDFELANGEEVEVSVVFTPRGADENFGQIIVRSDDPDTPEAPVDLLGFGDVPDLVITPASYQFGEGFIPCGGTVDLELANVGSEALEIHGVEYTSAGTMSIPLEEIRSELPLTLAEGETRTVTVTWAPELAGGDTGVLEVFSNDPGGKETADQNGEGQYVNEAQEQFEEPGQPAVDIFFLIDQSCSMKVDNEPALTKGMPSFVNTLQSVADWQMVQITETSACANVGIMTPNTANLTNIFLNHAFDADISDNITESLLKHAAKALSQTGPGDCNDGALRPGALLHLIIASDEREQSGTDWSKWVDTFRSYVSVPEHLRISSIVDLNFDCGSPGSDGPGGYLEASMKTGGELLDICDSAWGSQLVDIATTGIDGISTYNLANPAIESTIEVEVNGIVTTDWTYNEFTQSITINDPPVGKGDVVDVSYGVAAVCD